MRSPYWGASAISWSRTGPQYRLWHRAGVANIAITGLPFPMTWFSDCWWNEQGAGFDLLSVRVHSGSVPSVFAVVGLWMLRPVAPTIGVSGFALTGKARSASG